MSAYKPIRKLDPEEKAKLFTAVPDREIDSPIPKNSPRLCRNFSELFEAHENAAERLFDRVLGDAAWPELFLADGVKAHAALRVKLDDAAARESERWGYERI